MIVWKRNSNFTIRNVIACILILLVMLQAGGLTVYAEGRLISITGAVLNDQLNFKMDGKTVVPVGDDGTPVLPISYNGTTYLPVRAIGYLLGLGIDYDGPTKTVLITSTTTKAAPVATNTVKSNTLIPITNAVLNEQLKFKLDDKSVVPVGDDGSPVLPISYNGTTYLPVRAIGYLLNLGIDYDGPTKTVLISRPGSASITPGTKTQVWKLKEVKFVDGSQRIDSVLMGTTAYQYDLISYKGGQNDLTITQNRYDLETNVLLAGITFQVKWTNPPEYLIPGEKITMHYELAKLDSLVWSHNSNSISLDQGMTVFLVSPNGVKYISSDVNADFTSEKVIEKGSKGRLRTLSVYHGHGFTTKYVYEWIE